MSKKQTPRRSKRYNEVAAQFGDEVAAQFGENFMVVDDLNSLVVVSTKKTKKPVAGRRFRDAYFANKA